MAGGEERRGGGGDDAERRPDRGRTRNLEARIEQFTEMFHDGQSYTLAGRNQGRLAPGRVFARRG